MLPLALNMAGRQAAKSQPQRPDCWQKVHENLKDKATMFGEMKASERVHLFSTIETSCDMLPPQQQERFRLMVIVAQGVAATRELLASLWDTVRAFALDVCVVSIHHHA